MQCGPVDALILPVQPAGQGTPYIINTCDLSGTEKIFLNKSYGILDALSECSHKASYPHTFFIRTFGCNAYWMELIRFKCADK